MTIDLMIYFIYLLFLNWLSWIRKVYILTPINYKIEMMCLDLGKFHKREITKIFIGKFEICGFYITYNSLMRVSELKWFSSVVYFWRVMNSESYYMLIKFDSFFRSSEFVIDLCYDCYFMKINSDLRCLSVN